MAVELPSYTVPPKPKDNLFVALFPPDEVAEQIAQLATELRQAHALRGRQYHTSRLHMTLFCFNPLEVTLSTIAEACTLAAASTAPFEVRFDHVLSFPGRRSAVPFVLHGSNDNAALMDFYRGLESLFARSGTRFKGRPNFSPHVTLLYEERRVSKQAVKPVTWVAQELVLVHSLVGKSQYIPLARWDFCGKN
jgi:RNA 2',3'-cyclic 3'-phosphodiesterase